MHNILYISPYLSIGGTEKHILDLIKGFGDQNRLFLLAPPGETLELFQEQNVTYYPFKRLDRHFFSGLNEFTGNLKVILKENRIDLIHIHGAPELMFLTRRVNRETPLLFTVHGFHGEMKGWDYWLCARLCNRYASRVIAVAGAETKILLANGIKPQLIETILNGVPDPLQQQYEIPEIIRELKPSKTLIGAIARLENTKGIHILLEAFANICFDYPDLYLVIVGTGSKEAELQRQAAGLKIDQRVVFTGYRQDIHSFLQTFDIFTIPSLHEAHPLVLMEGMSHGKAIIATKVGGIPEVIEDGSNGLLIPPGDVKALTSALIKLLNDPDLGRILGKAARLTYENQFTVEKMVAKTWQVYEKLINRAKNHTK